MAPEPHTIPDPFPKVPSSVWDAVFPKKVFPWKRWPHAPNFLVEKQVWACEDGWIAQLRFSEYALLHLFWTSFVPSPVEVERKMFLGSYKCGFFFFPGFKSPLTLIIGEDGVSVLAKLARPLTTALFYWWAAETLWSAADTTHSILNREEFCEAIGNEYVGEDGGTFFSVSTAGPIGSWKPVYDPQHLCGASCAGINVPAGDFSAHVAAHFEVAPNSSVENCKIWLEMNGIPVAEEAFEDSKVNKGKSRMLTFKGHTETGATLIPWFQATPVPGLPFATKVVGDSFVVSWTP